MKHVTYHYTFRGEKKTRLESLATIVAKLKSDTKKPSDTTQLPTAEFAVGKNGEYTGLITIRLKTENADSSSVWRTIRLLRSQPQVQLVFFDSYREEIVTVVAYMLTDDSLPTEVNDVRTFHDTAFMQEAHYLKQLTGLDIVPDSAHLGYQAMLCGDANAWLNENVRPIKIQQPQQTVDESIRRNSIEMELPSRYDYASAGNLPGYDKQEMQMTRFQKCMNDMKNILPSDTALDLWLVALAEHCMNNGVGEEFAIKRLVSFSYLREKEVLVRECFYNVYAQDKVRRTSAAISDSQVLMNILIDYLPRRYEFRKNEMNGSVEYKEKGMFILDWQPVTKSVINTITIDAKRIGVEVWDRDIKRYIESNYVRTYNPLTDYLASVKNNWDGKDRIAALAARVPNDNPRWTELFHRWLLSAVSQWLGRDKDFGATVVPMLIGAQGDGKSTFCRKLLPENLRGFYTDRLDFTSKKDAERALSAFALINIDEYDSISKSQTAFLKHILQKANIMGRDPYAMAFSEHKRYAAFMATTNSLTPLVDLSGSRRYLCIRTTGKIDNESPIEYDQLYAQLMEELSRGERAYFNNDDEAYIQKQNGAFEVVDALSDTFTSLFELPENESDGTWLSASGMVKKMREQSKVVAETQSTYTRLGMMLRRQGFQQKRSHNGNLFCVKCR